MKRLPSLDGIRCMSIILVLGAHSIGATNFPDYLNPIFKYFFNGALGVQIFFVLSGFLITYLLLKEEKKVGHIALSNFYKRRILRIFPVYYIFIIALFIIDINTKLDITNCEYLSSLTFTKNLFCGTSIDGHLWRLSIEEQYYLLWPFVFKFLKGNNRLFFCLFFIFICPFARTFFYLNNDTGSLLFSPFSNFDSLFIGSMISILFLENEIFFKKITAFQPTFFRLLAFLFIYLIWFIKLKFLLGIISIPFGNTIQSIGIAYLILSYSQEEKGFSFKILNYPIVSFIGRLSFSIYIWQQLFFVAETFYTYSPLFFLNFPFNIFSILIISILSYYLIEKPFLKLRAKYK